MYGWIVSGLMMMVMGAGFAFAEERKDMGGWELDSPYNRYYHSAELDQLKGTVEKISTRVPLKDMAPAVVLFIKESGGETTMVHVCPEWYLGPKQMGLKKGDKVKIRGAWAEIGGEFVFMASKIKKGDYFELKVRLTKDGKPFWTMSPEEIARETAGD
jgi:hypothetical protein